MLLLLLEILPDTAVDGRRVKGGPIPDESVDSNDDGVNKNKRRRT